MGALFPGWSQSELQAAAEELEARISNLPGEIAAHEVRAQSGGGAVAAVMTGHGRLSRIEIADLSYRHFDPERLSGLIVEAVGSAARAAHQYRGSLLGQLSFAGIALSEFQPRDELWSNK